MAQDVQDPNAPSIPPEPPDNSGLAPGEFRVTAKFAYEEIPPMQEGDLPLPSIRCLGISWTRLPFTPEAIPQVLACAHAFMTDLIARQNKKLAIAQEIPKMNGAHGRPKP